MRRALLTVLALVLLLAPAAEAAGSPKTRADAEKLALLSLRSETRTTAILEDFEAEFDARTGKCSVTPDQAPEAVAEEVILRQVSLYLRAATGKIGPEVDRFLAQLQAFKTSDFRLRRTARSMAATNRIFLQLGPSAPDPCTYFEQWKAAGWATTFRIQPAVRNLSATEVRSIQRHVRRVRSGIRHMRKLGLSRKRTERLLQGWSGEELFGRLSL